MHMVFQASCEEITGTLVLLKAYYLNIKSYNGIVAI